MGASIGARTRDGARQWVRREEPTADMKPPGDPEILVAHEGNEYHPFGPDRGHLTHVRRPSVGFLRRPWRLMSCGKKKAFFGVGEMWLDPLFTRRRGKCRLADALYARSTIRGEVYVTQTEFHSLPGRFDDPRALCRVWEERAVGHRHDCGGGPAARYYCRGSSDSRSRRSCSAGGCYQTGGRRLCQR